MIRDILVSAFRIGLIAFVWLALVSSASGAQCSPQSAVAGDLQCEEDQPGPGRLGLKILERMADRLELTENQRTEILSIIVQERKKILPLLCELRENRRELLALSSSQATETEIRAVAEQQSRVLVEMIVAVHLAKAKVFELLSEEQRAKVQERIEWLMESRGFFGR